MIVSTTNIAKNATVTVTPDSSLQEISVITDGDYSSIYTDALTDSMSILFEFATPQDIGYLAIGGSNISSKTSIRIAQEEGPGEVFFYTSNDEQFIEADGLEFVVLAQPTIDDSILNSDESKTMMYKVDLLSVTFISITVYGSGGISIPEIAMGDYYEIPHGEQAGYNRPWSVPNVSVRSSIGLNAAPVNLSYEGRELSCTLSVPNNLMVDFDGWYKFIKFAATNTFYILEDDDKFHSYACFNAVPSMTSAHGQTRSLGVSSIRFSAHSKSTGVSF